MYFFIFDPAKVLEWISLWVSVHLYWGVCDAKSCNLYSFLGGLRLKVI